jgi:hypothetical protein
MDHPVPLILRALGHEQEIFTIDLKKQRSSAKVWSKIRTAAENTKGGPRAAFEIN